MTPWSIDETVFLVRHYATMPLAELSANLADFGVAERSISAIHARARYLDIHRENAGKFDGTNGAPPPCSSPLRDHIIRLFVERTELTVAEMSAATGSSASSCWKVCKRLKAQENIHISRYQNPTKAPGNWAAVYRVGIGKDAEKPAAKVVTKEVEPEDIIYEPQPVPRPALGLWGLVWNTTNPAQVAGERNLP